MKSGIFLKKSCKSGNITKEILYENATIKEEKKKSWKNLDCLRMLENDDISICLWFPKEVGVALLKNLLASHFNLDCYLKGNIITNYKSQLDLPCTTRQKYIEYHSTKNFQIFSYFHCRHVGSSYSNKIDWEYITYVHLFLAATLP